MAPPGYLGFTPNARIPRPILDNAMRILQDNQDVRVVHDLLTPFIDAFDTVGMEIKPRGFTGEEKDASNWFSVVFHLPPGARVFSQATMRRARQAVATKFRGANVRYTTGKVANSSTCHWEVCVSCWRDIVGEAHRHVDDVWKRQRPSTLRAFQLRDVHVENKGLKDLLLKIGSLVVNSHREQPVYMVDYAVSDLDRALVFSGVQSMDMDFVHELCESEFPSHIETILFTNSGPEKTDGEMWVCFRSDGLLFSSTTASSCSSNNDVVVRRVSAAGSKRSRSGGDNGDDDLSSSPLSGKRSKLVSVSP